MFSLMTSIVGLILGLWLGGKVASRKVGTASLILFALVTVVGLRTGNDGSLWSVALSFLSVFLVAFWVGIDRRIRDDRAKARAQQCVEAWAKQLPRESDSFLSALEMVSIANKWLIDLDKPATAIALYGQALTIIENKIGVHPYFYAAYKNYARALRQVGDENEATRVEYKASAVEALGSLLAQ